MIKLPARDCELLEPTLWKERYGVYLQRFAESRLGDSHSAEEVVQECFLAGWRCREQYAGAGTEQAWLVGILKRKILDYFRRSKRIATVGPECDEDCLPSDLPRWGAVCTGRDEPDSKTERAEFWQLVTLCLRKLTKRQAEVFRLREIEGFSTDQICNRLGISQSNFFVSLHRARNELSQSAQMRSLLDCTDALIEESETNR